MAETNDKVIGIEEYRAFREEVTKREGKPKPRKPVNANYTSYVLNGVEDNTLVKTDKIEVVSVSGPTEVKAGELATYTITAYKGEPTEKDKKRIYWSVYIDGKKSNRIRLQNDKENTDSTSDIYSGNKKKKAFILYIKKSPQEDKIEIKFSKWLDQKKVKVEAHKGMNSFDSSCQIETKIIAKPEILSIHWVNAKEQRIKFSGYDQDVFLSVITLGLKGKKLTLDIFDYDRHKEDDPLDWGKNSIAIKQRKTLKQFPIKKRADYGLQEKDDLTPNLELYVIAKSNEPLENPKEKYAYYLNLTPNELIRNAYFAEEEHIEVQKGEEKKPEPPKPPPAKPTNYTVVKGDDLAKIAKKKDVPYTQIMEVNPNTIDRQHRENRNRSNGE